MTKITKRQLRERLNVETEAAIAGFFGISASAVSQWDEDAPIPYLRQLEAERKRPDLFGIQAAAQASRSDEEAA